VRAWLNGVRGEMAGRCPPKDNGIIPFCDVIWDGELDTSAAIWGALPSGGVVTFGFPYSFFSFCISVLVD
jgi:hypothetical protein